MPSTSGFSERQEYSYEEVSNSISKSNSYSICLIYSENNTSAPLTISISSNINRICDLSVPLESFKDLNIFIRTYCEICLTGKGGHTWRWDKYYSSLKDHLYLRIFFLRLPVSIDVWKIYVLKKNLFFCFLKLYSIILF